MNFTELWDSSIHSDPEQVKRQKSAVSAKMTPISVDSALCSGSFKGSKSSIYSTTLSSCTCIDFTRRSLPCKHIYRLAHELHQFDLVGPVSSSSSAVLAKSEVMKIITSVLTEDEQKDFGYFCYICKNDNSGEKLINSSFADKLISYNLAQEVTDIPVLLSHLHIKEVRKFLPPGTKSPRTKKELIQLVAPLIPSSSDISFGDQKCLTLHSSIAHLGHALHREICRLYPQEDNDRNSWF